jgi:hypothetical protein
MIFKKNKTVKWNDCFFAVRDIAKMAFIADLPYSI